MAESVGRGRSQRHNAQEHLALLSAAKIVPLRDSAHTDPVLTETAKYEGYLKGLILAVSDLDITSRTELHDIRSKIMDYSISLPLMQNCVHRFHENALADVGFGRRAAAALATVSNLIVAETKLRNVLMATLESDFAASETLRTENKIIFTNMVTFHCQVFGYFEVNNEPIQVLSVSHLSYLARLLDGDMFELELFVLLLAQNGRKLAMCQPTNSLIMADLFVKLTTHLLSSIIDSNTRAWLMLALELHYTSYSLSRPLCKVFTAALGVKNMGRVNFAVSLGAYGLPLKALDEHDLQALKAGDLEEEDCTEVVPPSSPACPAARGSNRCTP